MGHELSAKNNRNKDLMRHTPYYKENKEEHYIKIRNNCSLDKITLQQKNKVISQITFMEKSWLAVD